MPGLRVAAAEHRDRILYSMAQGNRTGRILSQRSGERWDQETISKAGK